MELWIFQGHPAQGKVWHVYGIFSWMVLHALKLKNSKIEKYKLQCKSSFFYVSNRQIGWQKKEIHTCFHFRIYSSFNDIEQGL